MLRVISQDGKDIYPYDMGHTYVIQHGARTWYVMLSYYGICDRVEDVTYELGHYDSEEKALWVMYDINNMWEMYNYEDAHFNMTYGMPDNETAGKKLDMQKRTEQCSE